MFNEVILLKYGELILKGLNKSYFENQLLRDAEDKLSKVGSFDVKRAQSTIYISPKTPDEDMDKAFEAACRVFGIAAVCRAACVEKDMEVIEKTLPLYLSDVLSKAKTFKVEAKRSDKCFPLKSPEISAECGGVILSEFPHLRVNVKDPDVTVRVEIRDFGAYIHSGAVEGAGGMPNGTSGKGLLLLSGGIDSPVAGYLMAKRGVTVEALHFESYPYTSEMARDKVVDLAKIMSLYCGDIMVNIISLTHIQEEIMRNCREEYFTLILRRFMMRIAEKVALRSKAGALITGESLAQVASQTMGAIAVTNNALDKIPMLRPLIAMDKEEIVKIARKIGTFETSILPYEDCCTVFTPRHPTTKPVLENIIAEEQKLDVDALVREALESRYHKWASFGKDNEEMNTCEG